MTALSGEQRATLLARIAEERHRTVARAAALQRDFDEIVAGSADAVRDDEHDPEGATIAFERAQVAALLADARAHLAALDAAEQRLQRGDAGRCDRCGGGIGVERLVARPSALRCVRCASSS